MVTSKKKILVVDDDPAIRESILLAIQEQSYIKADIIESEDVSSGIKQLEKIKPDIVILDLHMPGKSGLDFIDIMRSNKDFAKTKVIMLSADDTLTNIFAAQNKGVDAPYFLGKPFNISELQAMVLSICIPPKS